MGIRLTRYGRREVALLTVAAAGACAAIAAAAWATSWAVLAAVAAPVALWACGVAFFRDPERTIPDAPGLLVSPADGRVTDVTAANGDGPLGCAGVRVGVFMSLLNVHVNRAPATCRVERVDHRPGAFFDARTPQAARRNEAATIYLSLERGGEEFGLAVRQVAGRVARRIVTDVTAGEVVMRGQRIGMIKFGSRLELWVPDRLGPEVRVAVGDRVRAGETVLVATGAGAAEAGE
jgi:phosphatidylserine decarboxylase